VSSFASVPLGYCVSEVRRKNLGGREQNLLSLSYGRIIRKDIDSAEGLLPESFDTYNIVEQGDTVLRLTDLQNDQRSLRVGLVEGRGIITSAYVTVRPSSRVNERFLNYFLKMMDFRKDFYALGAGVRQSLKFEELRGVQVAVPGLAVQRAIADYLDTETARIDALIAKKQRMIELLEARWGAKRNEAILRGVDPISGRGPLPASWDCPQLGVIVELQRGHDLPFEARREGSVPIVSSGGVTGYHDKPACAGPAVVTGRYGTVGEVYFMEEPCWPLNTTLYVKDFRGNNARWIAFALESIPLEAESEKSAVGGINRNVIGKLRVPRPPVSEQVQIAERLLRERELHVAAREKVTRQIELLREHRQALITAAVTGEIQVPGAAA
jgi:type I restriction enzyme S subunit